MSEKNNYYIPGSFYRSDDRTGRKVRAERTKKEWNNLIVDENTFEIRQPQDFVRGVRDDQTVPEARPWPPNNFEMPGIANILEDEDGNIIVDQFGMPIYGAEG